MLYRRKKKTNMLFFGPSVFHRFTSMTDQIFKYAEHVKLTCFLMHRMNLSVIYLKVQILFENRS